ncbi:hypothetical protein DL769_000471 [Monosporascus sp. CRB-8-3]|nr:hypothetical protein DL769_000471 [Monosporascus sp. CRB-8-3]
MLVRRAYYTRPSVMNTKGSTQLTSWRPLNSIPHANFDGLASAACPNPPLVAEGNSPAMYLTGKRVKTLRCTEEAITVNYVDAYADRYESIEAGMVTGADGVNSTVRQLANVPLTQRHIIPSDAGNFEPGERLLNWVRYYSAAEDSPEITAIFTDVASHLHRNTISWGLVRPEVRGRFRAELCPRISGPFQELLQKTPDPSVTKFRDVQIPRPAFYDRKVLLDGDVFTTLRPRLAASTEQAAFNSNNVGGGLPREENA